MSAEEIIVAGLGLAIALASGPIQRGLLHVYRDSPFVWSYKGPKARIGFVIGGIVLFLVATLPHLFGRCLLDCTP